MTEEGYDVLKVRQYLIARGIGADLAEP